MSLGSVRVEDLSDDVLERRLMELLARERTLLSEILTTIAEVDSRRLYLGRGFSSLYVYCLEYLHLSEHESFARIRAARLSRRFPIILNLIDAGDISLTALALLGPHLNEANHRELLAEARHRSRAQIEGIVARINPQAATQSVVRRAEVRPLAPELYYVSFPMSATGHVNLRRAQDLLRHSIPSGDIGLIFERALSGLVTDLEKRKFALVARPRETEGKLARPGARPIPAAVRRAVWARDRGRCAFVGTAGRCRERGFLELHHVKPFAAGGEATVDNIELRCRAHNAHEADLYFTSQPG